MVKHHPHRDLPTRQRGMPPGVSLPPTSASCHCSTAATSSRGFAGGEPARCWPGPLRPGAARSAATAPAASGPSSTGLGPIEVRQPGVQDRRPPGEREAFRLNVLPPYLRRTKNVGDAIPWLYLKGISTGDFPEALQGLFGVEAKGISATTSTLPRAGRRRSRRSTCS